MKNKILMILMLNFMYQNYVQGASPVIGSVLAARMQLLFGSQLFEYVASKIGAVSVRDVCALYTARVLEDTQKQSVGKLLANNPTVCSTKCNIVPILVYPRELMKVDLNRELMNVDFNNDLKPYFAPAHQTILYQTHVDCAMQAVNAQCSENTDGDGTNRGVLAVAAAVGVCAYCSKSSSEKKEQGIQAGSCTCACKCEKQKKNSYLKTAGYGAVAVGYGVWRFRKPLVIAGVSWIARKKVQNLKAAILKAVNPF